MRCDLYLSQYGFAESRSKARVLIDEGAVKIDGMVIKKASDTIEEDIEHLVEIADVLPFVSRGGLKLEFALKRFAISAEGAKALDVGASTGGFTDCLLKRGAEHVIAVDSGEKQMASSLRADPRVTCVEKYNARYMKSTDFSYEPNLVVMDVSFISQTLILGALSSVMTEEGVLVSLIKPQFEVGRSAVGKNGIVKKAEDRGRAIEHVLSVANSFGLGCFALTRSPITGGDGNIEFLAAFRKGAPRVINEKKIKDCMEGKI